MSLNRENQQLISGLLNVEGRCDEAALAIWRAAMLPAEQQFMVLMEAVALLQLNIDQLQGLIAKAQSDSAVTLERM